MDESTRRERHSAGAEAQRAAESVTAQVRTATQEAAAKAKHETLSFTDDQKQAMAERMTDLAGTLRSTASQMAGSRSEALAPLVARAAERVDAAAEAVRGEDVRALLGRTEDFARRQPSAFLGASVAVGFALGRFLRSSGARHRETSEPARPALPTGSAEPVPTPDPRPPASTV